jgi:O-succinylbenzoic acid--CoA ligase
MFDVDFDNPAPQLICHPGLKKYENEILTKLNPFFLRDHFILFSSGTTGGDLKGYALSKKALFANAQAVNQHFQLTSDDVWGLSLPVYHVGGLSVLARAHLLNNRVVDARSWNPDHWQEKMKDVTITTIVPTQLYDLVKCQKIPSAKLRYIIVGGDFLSSELKREALKLGWPVIRTFGMSEVSSQLASAVSPDSDDLIVLNPHEVKTEDGRLLVKSKAMFTLEFSMGEKFRISTARELCSKDGFYYTKDRARVEGKFIIPEGRMGDDIKISGHLVNLNDLKDTLSTFLLEHDLFMKMELQVKDDERKGKKLVLFSQVTDQKLIERCKERLSPVKIDDVIYVEGFERTALGKLKKDQPV